MGTRIAIYILSGIVGCIFLLMIAKAVTATSPVFTTHKVRVCEGGVHEKVSDKVNLKHCLFLQGKGDVQAEPFFF